MTHAVLPLVGAQVEVHQSLLPRVALRAGLGPHRRAQVRVPGDVDIEGLDRGAVHVVPEGQTLDAGARLGGALQASFVVVPARGRGLDVDVVAT